MKLRPLVVLFLLVSIFVAMPLVDVQAQSQFIGDAGPAGIVPCGDIENGESPCGVCHLISLAQETINFGVYLTVFVATLLFVYAGFLYIFAGGNPGNVKKATGIFWKVLVGMIIVLIAWLAVDTIMKTFLTTEGEYGPWNEILCIDVSSDPGARQFPPSDTADSGQQQGGQQEGLQPAGETAPFTPDADEYTHAEAKDQLDQEGVIISSSGGCSDRTNSSCTSLDGVKKTTVAGAIFLKKQCASSLKQACPMSITGGTEMGVHNEGEFSHENGHKIDVSESNAQLGRFILGQQEAQASSGQKTTNTFILTDEDTGESYQYTVRDEGHLDLVIKQLKAPRDSSDSDTFLGF